MQVLGEVDSLVYTQANNGCGFSPRGTQSLVRGQKDLSTWCSPTRPKTSPDLGATQEVIWDGFLGLPHFLPRPHT